MSNTYIRPIGGLAVLVASLFAVVLSAQQNPRELFERARLLEDSNQDLTDAISLYGQVVEQASGQRALAATAQLRLGLLYERLGRTTDAQRAFTAVVTEYADQRDVAQQAQARLASPDATGREAAMLTRRVWDGPRVDLLGALLPDGRSLTYTDWQTGDLAIRDLATGDTRPVTDKGSWQKSDEYAEASRPSPDGQQIAYTWVTFSEGAGVEEVFNAELRLIGIDGSEPRVLYSSPEVLYVQPAAWTPDGTHIVATIARNDTNQIGLISVADGSLQVLKTLGWQSSSVSLSPDGRHIVYDVPPQDDSPNRDIFLLAIDGSREVPLVEHPANDGRPIWTADGTRVLFVSDRAGTVGLWVLRVADGQPQGSPELVKRDMGLISPIGLTRDGAFYYGLNAGMTDVAVARLDPATGMIGESPETIAARVVGSNFAPDWSPDGESLAYISGQDGFGIPGWLRIAIAVRVVEIGEERVLTLPLRTLGSYRSLRWSPNGRSLLVQGVDDKGRQGFYEVDSRTGEITPRWQIRCCVVQGAVWSRDGAAIIHPLMERLVRREIDTGHTEELYRTPSGGLVSYVTVSPDGRQLAFVAGTEPRQWRGVVIVMPAGGGEPRELVTVEDPIVSLAWTADGREVLFVTGHSNPLARQPNELWRIAADGGEPRPVGLAREGLRDLSVHPDGRRVAFTAGPWAPRSELWVLENFLAELEGQD